MASDKLKRTESIADEQLFQVRNDPMGVFLADRNGIKCRRPRTKTKRSRTYSRTGILLSYARCVLPRNLT